LAGREQKKYFVFPGFFRGRFFESLPLPQDCASYGAKKQQGHNDAPTGNGRREKGEKMPPPVAGVHVMSVGGDSRIMPEIQNPKHEIRNKRRNSNKATFQTVPSLVANVLNL
jgi:hypothetical protein